MWSHVREVILALLYICVYVTAIPNDNFCNSVSAGPETDVGDRFIYPLRQGTVNFQIHIPECELGEKTGVKVTVCDNSTPEIQLDGLNYMEVVYIERTGDISYATYSDILLLCE